jgi:hypothetical protein
MANGGNGVPPGRALTVSVLLSVFVPALTIGSGIYFAGGWAGRIEERLTAIENKTVIAATHETRISNLEFRLNWIDAAKKDERESDKEISGLLTKLHLAVTRLEAIINDPYKRRR